jgi:hypothetical protein
MQSIPHSMVEPTKVKYPSLIQTGLWRLGSYKFNQVLEAGICYAKIH